MAAEHNRDSCLFCKIVDGKEDTQILFQNDVLVIFKDIRPAAKHHYLIVTREHYKNAKILDHSHLGLVEQMVCEGKSFLSSQGGDVSDVRFGFHWPPFHSIAHLHLHVISPVKDMGFVSRLIFRPDCYWFVSSDYVINRLKKMPEKEQIVNRSE